MNGKSMHWVSRLAVLGLAVGLTAGFAVAGAAQSVSGRAYSTYVNTPLGSSGYSPLAVLPAVSGTDGAEADAQGDALNVAGALSGDSSTASRRVNLERRSRARRARPAPRASTS